jgi:hypothetical protein
LNRDGAIAAGLRHARFMCNARRSRPLALRSYASSMPIPSPVLEAINLELRELEAVAARMRELDERELLDLYPQIAAVREALRALIEELERRA